MRDALKPAQGAGFRAAGCPRLCDHTETGGVGAAAPTGQRPGHARERAQR